jgi:hypothetical protein
MATMSKQIRKKIQKSLNREQEAPLKKQTIPSPSRRSGIIPNASLALLLAISHFPSIARAQENTPKPKTQIQRKTAANSNSQTNAINKILEQIKKGQSPQGKIQLAEDGNGVVVKAGETHLRVGPATEGHDIDEHGLPGQINPFVMQAAISKEFEKAGIKLTLKRDATSRLTPSLQKELPGINSKNVLGIYTLQHDFGNKDAHTEGEIEIKGKPFGAVLSRLWGKEGHTQLLITHSLGSEEHDGRIHFGARYPDAEVKEHNEKAGHLEHSEIQESEHLTEVEHLGTKRRSIQFFLSGHGGNKDEHYGGHVVFDPSTKQYKIVFTAGWRFGPGEKNHSHNEPNPSLPKKESR